MEKLIKELTSFKKKLDSSVTNQLSDEILDKIYTVYPFNKFEYVISHLIANNAITLEQYIDMRSEYLERNKYLYLFELAPRTFGETWGQRHLMEFVQDFKVPSRTLDSNYSGQYDLWLDDIHVEVKASRVVNKRGGSTLSEKALASGSGKKFDMNYQQLKPSCCDVFVWIAVWRDKIDYWVLPRMAVQHPEKFISQDITLSNQHRGSQSVEGGEVVEGQIHINDGNYAKFEPFRSTLVTLKEDVINASMCK